MIEGSTTFSVTCCSIFFIYGLTLSSCLNRIVHHRTNKKFAEDNVTLKEFLKEYQKNYADIVKLCRETLPEKFDTGE